MFKKSLLILLLICSVNIMQGQSDDPAKRKKEIEEEIAQLDKQLSLNKSKQQSGIKELNLIKRKIANRNRLLRELEKEISKIETQIDQKEKAVNTLESNYTYLKRQYSKLIYTSYKNRDQKMWLSYVLASENLSQGYRRWVYFRNYATAVRSKANYIKQKEKQIRAEKEELGKIKTKSVSTKEIQKREALKLEKEQKNAQNIINQLSTKEREFRNQLASKKKEVERLNKELEKILNAAVKDKSKPSYRESPEDKILSDKFENNRGKLPWPVKRGEITDAFGQHNHRIYKNIKLPFNNGVNIATDPRAEVYCVFEGVVKQVLMMPGYNQCILVQHGNYFTFYCKLDKVRVKSGEKVITGQNLGSLAETSDGSEIHFQLWNGTSKQDPQDWLSNR